jgi:uncharacterized protein YggE
MKNILIAMVLSLLLVAGCVDLGEKATVSASGRAVLKVDPDKADIIVAIEHTDKSAQVAKDKVAASVEKIYEELYKLDIPRKDIATEYFNIYEEFDWTQEGGRKSLGYKTVHTLKITTENFDNIGDIVDAAVDAGATSVQSISFDMTEQRRSELRRQALEEASKDARMKAEAIASGLNGRLGSIVSVSDVAYDYMPYRGIAEPMAASVAKDEVDTIISPGQLDVTANIQVVYEIKN